MKPRIVWQGKNSHGTDVRIVATNDHLYVEMKQKDSMDVPCWRVSDMPVNLDSPIALCILELEKLSFR
jgi:hypothetical protein